jgi:hypothetical protein
MGVVQGSIPCISIVFVVVLSFWIRPGGGAGDVVGALWAGVNIPVFDATRTSLELQALILLLLSNTCAFIQ